MAAVEKSRSGEGACRDGSFIFGWFVIYLSISSHLLLFTRAGIIMCCTALAVVAGRVLLSAESRKAVDLALTAFLGCERASKLINTVSACDVIFRSMHACPFKIYCVCRM